MIAYLPTFLAVILTGIIVVRCICVLHQTTAKKHRHPLLFLGFGYSYVTLGAGAIVAALALVFDHDDLEQIALWLMLAGSVGLIIFDRRSAKCWTFVNCPMERKGPLP